MRARRVTSRLESQIVGFKSGADPPQGCIDRHVALVLVEVHAARPTLHRRQPGLQLHVLCIRTLKIVLWRMPQEVQGGAASADAAAREFAGYHPVAFRVQKQVAVAAHDICLSCEQIAERRLTKIALNAGRQEPKTTAALLPLDARDE